MRVTVLIAIGVLAVVVIIGSMLLTPSLIRTLPYAVDFEKLLNEPK